MDLDALVRRVVDSRSLRIQERGVLVEVQGRLHTPDCSPEVAAVVFETLLDNALARCPAEGGRIRIGWLPASSESRVFFLSDNGSGAAAEVAAGAEAEAEGSESHEVTEMLQRNGGLIWREVEPGSGTTIFMVLGRDGATGEGAGTSASSLTFGPE